MLARVEGCLADVTGTACVVQTEGGVGYEIALPGHTLARLPERGRRVGFYTSLMVREDALELFGFDTWDERQTFRILVSVSKVGARTALNMLSLYRPDDLRRLVLEEDMAALTRVPGIGKKTAQHILLELRYKLKGETVPAPPGLKEQGATVFRDALTGLTNLGYNEEEAAPVLTKALHDEPDLDVSGALRAALKRLARSL